MRKKIILFQGDSVTDCARIRFLSKSLGHGYCGFLGQILREKGYKVLNKGAFGNTTENLKARWHKDTLSIKPDILSLLIGINDTWRRYDKDLITPIEKFEQNYRYFLESILSVKPSTKIIIMSQFLLPLDEKQEAWFEDLLPKIKVVERLAKEYGAIYIPLQDIFDAKIKQGYSPADLTKDGVHPTRLGHKIIVEEWIKYFENF